MKITAGDVKEKFPNLIVEIIGNPQAVINKLGTLNKSDKDDLLFVFDEKYLERALTAAATTLVIPKKLKDRAKGTKTFLLSSNSELTMAMVIDEFFAPKNLATCAGKVDAKAVIGKNCRIGKDVAIGPYAIIGDNVEIGDKAQISSHCVVESGAKIGRASRLFPFSFVGRDCVVGDECMIQSHAAIGSHGFGYAHDEKGNHYHKFHLGRVILGNRVDVGAGTMIDRGTIDDSVIGEGTKIDNLCHFGHNIVTGKNCLITAGFISAGSVEIGNNFVCGGRTTIAGHIKIGDNVLCAGHSTFGKSHDEPGQFGGYPIVPISTYKKNVATTAHLAEMRKSIQKLMKKIFPNEEST